MSGGLVELATAGCQALAAVAQEIPGIRKLFASKDDRIRAIAVSLQAEIIGYCNHLEHRVKEARHTLDHDKDLLSRPLSAIDDAWSRHKGRWKTLLQSAPSKKVKAMLLELDGFGDRLAALLICQDQEEQLAQRAGINGHLTVAYSALLGSDRPIGEILDRIERDAENLRKEAAALGTL